MKALISIFICLWMNSLFAQNWCPPGAEWYFDYAEPSIGDDGYMYFNYEGDTMVNGTQYQILNRIRYSYNYQTQNFSTWNMNPIYTSVSGGVVEMTDNLVDHDTIYDFDANIGDRWGPHPEGGFDTSHYILVTDTGTTDIDGISLKYRLVEYVNGIFGPMPDTLIERLGYLRLTMQTLDAFTFDVGTYHLRCYFDQDISYQNPNYPTCDYILGLDDLEGGAHISVFPNPASQVLNVEGLNPNAAYNVELFDQTGRRVIQETFRDRSTIQVGELESGMYLYRIRPAKGGQAYSGRFVKE